MLKKMKMKMEKGNLVFRTCVPRRIVLTVTDISNPVAN